MRNKIITRSSKKKGNRTTKIKIQSQAPFFEGGAPKGRGLASGVAGPEPLLICCYTMGTFLTKKQLIICVSKVQLLRNIKRDKQANFM